MIYGYARVSSVGQAKDGNSLEAQEKALRERGCKEVFAEAYTGTTAERPELMKVLNLLREGDTLMVTKLDRFSRSASEGVRLIQDLQKRGIIIEILNMGRADNTPMGRLMVTMLLAFAEFEHDQIIERLATGKAIAKAHGKKTDGRNAIATPAFEDYLRRNRAGEMSVAECCKALGVSRGTWYNRVKAVEPEGSFFDLDELMLEEAI